MDKPLVWQGKALKTFGEIMDVVQLILRLPDARAKTTAADFMRVYRESVDRPSIADENVGYLIGYLGSDQMEWAWTVFGVAHPVFGRRVPTPKEAFDLGLKAGEKARGR